MFLIPLSDRPALRPGMRLIGRDGDTRILVSVSPNRVTYRRSFPDGFVARHTYSSPEELCANFPHWRAGYVLCPKETMP